jgi:hypothetical protein
VANETLKKPDWSYPWKLYPGELVKIFTDSGYVDESPALYLRTFVPDNEIDQTRWDGYFLAIVGHIPHHEIFHLGQIRLLNSKQFRLEPCDGRLDLD